MNTEQISEQARQAAMAELKDNADWIPGRERPHPYGFHVQSAITAATAEARAEDAETFAVIAGERDELKRHVADLERQLVVSLENAAPLKAQLEESQMKARQKRDYIRELIRKIRELERQLAEATSLIEQRDRQLGECTESAQVIRQWLTEATTERDQLRAANAEQAKEIERLRGDLAATRERNKETERALRNVLAVIDAHELESLDCDRAGVRWCDCLENEVKAARAALAKEDKQP